MINLLKYMLFAGILLSRPALSTDADGFTLIEDPTDWICMDDPAWDFCSEASDEDTQSSSDNHLPVDAERLVAPAIPVIVQRDTDSFAHTSTQTDPEIPLHICIGSGLQTETELTDRSTDELAAEKSPLELVTDKIEKLIAEKTKDISDPENVIQHGYALLLMMGHFNSKASSVFGAASANAAGYVVGVASGSPVSSAVWSAAGANARQASRNSALATAGAAARKAATNAAMRADAQAQAAKYTIWDIAKSAVTFKVKSRLTEKNLTGSESLGNVAYQLAEEEMLTYLSKDEHINPIFNTLFDTALKAVKADKSIKYESGIFRSQKVWQEFKETYFGLLTDEAKIYLIPWLSQLDKLVEMSS
ncbi:MAG: hypothetical protein H6618_08435 [Deltaproteobacteria bacterium]|nr:hypothetical protein [Deltaproteobacteria bacterium]